MDHQPFKPAYVKGFMWFAFSGTAMLCAVVLPIHAIQALMGLTPRLDAWYLRVYFVVLIVATLYHGLYRAKTILFDLGFLAQEKIIGIIAAILFVIFSALSVAAFLPIF